MIVTVVVNDISEQWRSLNPLVYHVKVKRHRKSLYGEDSKWDRKVLKGVRSQRALELDLADDEQQDLKIELIMAFPGRLDYEADWRW